MRRFVRKAMLGGVVIAMLAALSGCSYVRRISEPDQPSGGNGATTGAVTTPDGKSVLFTSTSSNLLAYKNTFLGDAIVRNRATGTTVLASRPSAGGLGNATSSGVTITPDGRFVLFNSDATNMAGAAIGGVFLRDLTGGTTERVSIGSGGTQITGSAYGHAITPNGRYVVFIGAAGALPGGAGSSDVYLRDRQAGTTTRMSVSTGGAAGNGVSSEASISADGRYVVYTSDANNLVPNDTNFETDVFLHDRQTNTTTRVSITDAEAQANSFSLQSSMSDDGRFIAFLSAADNLVAGDNVGQDIFVRDRTSGTTTRVSIADNESEANGPTFGAPAISTNGRYVVFASGASNLVAGDTNGADDVFVRDRTALTTTRVSVTGTNTQANDSSSGGSVSPDGLFVAFDSLATNLAPNDTNTAADTFLRDKQAVKTERASVTGDGNGSTTFPMDISADGRYIAFTSASANLIPVDSNGESDVFVRDVVAGTIARVSISTAGVEGNGASFDAAISPNGRFVAFASGASNLFAGDTNGFGDIYVRDRQNNTTTRMSGTSVLQPNGNSFDPDVNDLGDVVFTTQADNLHAGDTNLNNDVYLQHYPGGLGATPVSYNWTTLTFGNFGSSQAKIGHLPNNGPEFVSVVFQTDATNLFPAGAVADTNNATDILLQQQEHGVHKVISATTGAIANLANSSSFEPALSDDGKFVAFQSAATNLVAGDTNGHHDIFRREILGTGGNNALVSLSTGGVLGNLDSAEATISGDGRFVGFSSQATNLVPGDVNGVPDIFTHDMLTGLTTRVSLTQDGVELPFNSIDPTLSSNGRYIAFRSSSTVAPNDSNERSDVYIRFAVQPTVSTFTPANQARGTTVTHTVTGTRFLTSPGTFLLGGPGVTINSVTYVSPTQVNVSMTVAADAPTGPRTVIVANTGLNFQQGAAGQCVNCMTVT